MRPVIAITSGRRPSAAGQGPRIRPPRMQVVVDEAVVTRVREAGGVAVVLPPGDPGALAALGPRIHGVVITGGAFDIHPRHYGREVRGRLDTFDDARTELELDLVRSAVARDLPLLGVCGGMQAMVVALGGTLIQDLLIDRPGVLDHEQAGDPAEPGHALLADAGWAHLFPRAVNSTHHQAADELGPLRPVAHAPDGVIEAVVLPGRSFCVGVQWHPELLDGRLYQALVDAARARAGSGA